MELNKISFLQTNNYSKKTSYRYETSTMQNIKTKYSNNNFCEKKDFINITKTKNGDFHDKYMRTKTSSKVICTY